VEGQGTMFRIGPLGRLGLALGQFPPLATLVESVSPAVVPRHDELAWGRYLALSVCSECHGADLRGNGEFAPDLRIAAAFQEGDWFALLRTGRGLGGRELDLMALVAETRFQYLTDAEIRALRAYLGTLAD
jgi:mono/diheme cytochrome c family protein